MGRKLDYKPKIKKMIEKRIAVVSKDVEVIQKKDIERRVVKMAIKGHSFDAISQRVGISTNEAHKIVREITARWLKEEALSSLELREVMVKQVDLVLALAMHEAFPHPMNDDYGQPLMIKKCDCDGNSCDEEGHSIRAMSAPDIRWAGMIESILDRKAKLLGLDAAQRLEEQKVDILQRVYKGVDAKVIEDL